MALWKDPVKTSPDTTPESDSPARFDMSAEAPATKAPPKAAAPAPVHGKSDAESLIAPDITIEGKIEGSGHVRVAGRFEGDINVHGDLTIEPSAKVTGSVRANKVTIAGELIGNIEEAEHVELLNSGALTGDVKAATLTVAAGSRMRGQADFGWDDSKVAGNRTASGAREGGKHNGPREDAKSNGAGHSLVT